MRTNSHHSALSCGPQNPADCLKTRDQRVFLKLVTNKRPRGPTVVPHCGAAWLLCPHRAWIRALAKLRGAYMQAPDAIWAERGRAYLWLSRRKRHSGFRMKHTFIVGTLPSWQLSRLFCFHFRTLREQGPASTLEHRCRHQDAGGRHLRRPLML
jgi:hypothetical protein